MPVSLEKNFRNLELFKKKKIIMNYFSNAYKSIRAMKFCKLSLIFYAGAIFFVYASTEKLKIKVQEVTILLIYNRI